MKYIYAVSAGSYSDYRVHAVFSTKKLAKEFMRLVPYHEYNDIETFELDPQEANLINGGYSLWDVLMLIDGTVEKVEEGEITLYSCGCAGHSIWRRSQAPAYRGKGIPDVLKSTVWAKSEEHAIKIVNEHRAQMIAEGKWNS